MHRRINYYKQGGDDAKSYSDLLATSTTSEQDGRLGITTTVYNEELIKSAGKVNRKIAKKREDN